MVLAISTDSAVVCCPCSCSSNNADQIAALADNLDLSAFVVEQVGVSSGGPLPSQSQPASSFTPSKAHTSDAETPLKPRSLLRSPESSEKSPHDVPGLYVQMASRIKRLKWTDRIKTPLAPWCKAAGPQLSDLRVGVLCQGGFPEAVWIQAS